MYYRPSPSSIFTILLTNLVTESGKSIVARGADLFQALQLVDHGLWDHPSMDPDSCGIIATFSPVGPWPESEYLSLCASLFMLISKYFGRMTYGTTAIDRCKL